MLNAAPNPNQLPGPPHFVDLHVNPGESVSIQFYDGNETVLRGPTTIKMISQYPYPPMPMPVQVPPGHMIQQVVDEHGTLKHIILSALNANGAMNSGANGGAAGGAGTQQPTMAPNPTPAPPPFIPGPGNPTPVVAAAAAAHQPQYCCCCNNTCGGGPPNGAGIPTAAGTLTAPIITANHHQNALVFPPTAAAPPPPPSLNHNPVAAAVAAAPGTYVRNRRSGTRQYPSPNKRPSNNYGGASNNVAQSSANPAASYYGGGGGGGGSNSTGKGAGTGATTARQFMAKSITDHGGAKSTNQYHRYLNSGVQSFDRANYSGDNTANHTGGSAYYPKYAMDQHAYQHHSSNHSSGTLDHNHVNKYYHQQQQPIQYGGGANGGIDYAANAAINPTPTPIVIATKEKQPTQPSVDQPSPVEVQETMSSQKSSAMTESSPVEEPSSPPVVTPTEDQDKARSKQAGDQSNVDNEQPDGENKELVADDAPVTSSCTVVDNDDKCADVTTDQAVIEPVIHSVNDNDVDQAELTSDIVVVPSSSADNVTDGPGKIETKTDKCRPSSTTGGKNSASDTGMKKLSMAVNGHCSSAGVRPKADSTAKTKVESKPVVESQQPPERELSKPAVSVPAGSTTPSSRSPKHMLPKVEALTLTCTNVSSTCVRLKWAFTQPDQYPADQKRNYIVDQTSLTTDTDADVSGSSTRMAHQGPNMSCRVVHLQPQHEYEFRVRTPGERAMLVSNVLTVVTPVSTPSSFKGHTRRTNKQLHHQVTQQQQLIYQQQQQLLQHQHRQQIMEHGQDPDGHGSDRKHVSAIGSALLFARQIMATAAEKMIMPLIRVSSEQGCALLIVTAFTVVSLVVAVLINRLLGNHW